MKLGQIIEWSFWEGLEELSSKDVPVSLAWKISGIMSEVEDVKKRFVKVRWDLLHKYGELNEAGELMQDGEGSYSLKDKQSFDKEFQELIDLEVQISTLSLSELGEVKISSKCLHNLRPIILK